MRAFLLLLTAAAAAFAEAPPSLFIDGYAGKVSVAQGEPVPLHVSTTAAVFDVEVACLGREREVVWRKAGVKGTAYPVPEDASANGCGWPAALDIPVGADWKSGYYEVALKAADRGGKWTARGARTAAGSAFFIVRAAKPGATSKILLQLATNTQQH